MANKAKIVGLLAVIIALAAFTLFVFSRTGKYSASMQTLPDGSLLELTSITFTNGSHSFKASPVKGWQEKIAKFLPRSVTSRLGWVTFGGSMIIGGRANGTNLAAFTICEMAGNNNFGSFQETHLQVFDDLGNTFDGGPAMGTLGSFGGKTSYRVDGWVPPAFPRRGRIIGFRYYENLTQTNGFTVTKGPTNGYGSAIANKIWQPVAEFIFPNPAPGHYPTWTPEPIPATKTDGDLSVTLEQLQTGLSKTDWTRDAQSNEPSDTLAKLRVVHEGRTTLDWRPISLNISDATGNDWLVDTYLVSVKDNADSYLFGFGGALWPGEAAWKLRFEFSRVTNFAPEEVFTFSGIPAPNPNDVTLLDNSTNIAGTKLQLIAITGMSAEQPGNLKWSTAKKYVNISIRIDPSEPGKRLTLIKITDEQGREAEIRPDTDWNAPERVFGFKTAAGPKSLNFTFAYHKSRFVEFLAKPEFVHPN